VSATFAEPAAGALDGGTARSPLLTLGVLAVTAVTGLAQVADPGLLTRLERIPAELHGDWWRVATALFVQDGGVAGAVSNLAFLGLIGVAAEQVLSRPRWLLHYFGIGLAVEVLAYSWQPTGAGNSIAVCGLAGGVGVACLRGDSRLPAYSVAALLIWCGALLGTLSNDLVVPGVVLAGAAAALAARHPERAELTRRLTPFAVAATGVVLAAAANIHGAALLAGLALALILPAPGMDVQLVSPGRGSR
jgi:membrane associated rhomboid family serine protease